MLIPIYQIAWWYVLEIHSLKIQYHQNISLGSLVQVTLYMNLSWDSVTECSGELCHLCRIVRRKSATFWKKMSLPFSESKNKASPKPVWSDRTFSRLRNVI
jgi:hypothetical protein